MPPNDYIGAIFAKPEDAVQYGRKGMKWGVLRSKEELSKEGPAKTDSPPKTPAASAKAPEGPETAQGRYARLAAVAKAGQGKSMSEEDLRFFNARTDAIAKVNKLAEKDPAWLSKTAMDVIQKTAKRSMQELSDTLASKYITKPIADAIKAPLKEAKGDSKKD